MLKLYTKKTMSTSKAVDNFNVATCRFPEKICLFTFSFPC